MQFILVSDRNAMGNWVARHAADAIRDAIRRQGNARIAVATGASQLEVLAALIEQPDVRWECVEAFHLDEYIGIAADHPASFCKYLKERFADKLPLANFHYLPGDQDPQSVIDRIGTLLQEAPIDVALVGIGENAHLAFNDPPADFEATAPYLLVELDQACRNQQVGEGWYPTIDDVPSQAISMSIQQILKSKKIFCSVPDHQKANAVRLTLEEPIDKMIPASILRTHPAATLIIDQAAAADLSPQTLAQFERVEANG